MGRNTVFIGEHRTNPKRAIGRYGADDALQIVALQSLRGKDLSHFLPLSFRKLIDVALLAPAESLELLALGAGSRVVAGGHRESVADEVRNAEDQDDRRREPRTGHSGDHRERSPIRRCRRTPSRADSCAAAPRPGAIEWRPEC